MNNNPYLTVKLIVSICLLFISFMAAAQGSADGGSYNSTLTGYSFSLPDMAGMQGDTIVIPVSMTNSNEITAFQTDIFLPEGFELVMEDGDYIVDLSDRKARDHIIMANDAGNGVIRVLSFSPSLKPYSGNDGVLFFITVRVPDNVYGIHSVQLKNTLLTDIDEMEMGIPDATGDITVFMMGDVNNSGTITVTDAVVTARYILNYNPDPFVFNAADINGDGNITVNDVVKIVRLVLISKMNASRQEPLPLLSDDRLSAVMEENATTGHRTVTLNLDNQLEYCAFQFDLHLPAGMSASDFVLSGRASSLNFDVNELQNGKLRVLGFSPSLRTIEGNEGALLTFDVYGGNSCDEMILDAIELVTPQGQSVHLDGFSIGLNHNSAISKLSSQVRMIHTGRNIVIDSPVAQTVIISDMVGHIWQTTVAPGCNTITVDHAGIYLISIAGETTKLMIK